MERLLECVPNVSEGRDGETIDAIAAAVERHARVLDVHTDPDHHRSVLTCAGAGDALVDALAAAVAVAVERIDLRRHDGVHPRVGAVDVVPFVRFTPGDTAPERAARALGERVGALDVPVLGYGEIGDGRRPAFYRAGGTEVLARRLAAGEVEPLYGPTRLHPSAGALLLGVRPPLVAFNVNLATDRVEIARAIAAAVRERDGGLPGVQAIGLLLERARVAQVSTNLVDVAATPLWRVVAEIERLAREHGAEVREAELVGLVPVVVAAEAAGHALRLPALPPERVLEVAAFGRFG
jgi:glutamate formiminotransferase